MNSKLALFKRMLSHYTNPYLSLEQRFVNPEKRASKRYHKLQEARFGKPSFKGFVDIVSSSGIKVYPFEEDLTTFIGMVTDKDCEDKVIEETKQYLLKAYPRKIKSIDLRDRDEITITLRDKKITAFRLSKVFPQLLDICPYMETMERQSRCHESSMYVSMSCPDTTCVTGVQTVLSSNMKFLHSWVELELGGKETVFDVNENLLMKKEDYYKLFMVKPLERITHQQLWDDHHEVLKLMNVNEHYSKLYLCSRQEALRLAKNVPDVYMQGITLVK